MKSTGQQAGAKKRRPRHERELAARMLKLLADEGDIRRRKARLVRGKIRARVYENDLKLQIAMEKLMRDALGPLR